MSYTNGGESNYSELETEEDVVLLGFIDAVISDLISYDIEFERTFLALDTSELSTPSKKLILHGNAQITIRNFKKHGEVAPRDSFQFQFNYISSDGKTLKEGHVELTYWVNFLKFLDRYIGSKYVDDCLTRLNIKTYSKNSLPTDKTFEFGKKQVFRKRYLDTGSKTPPNFK